MRTALLFVLLAAAPAAAQDAISSPDAAGPPAQSTEPRDDGAACCCFFIILAGLVGLVFLATRRGRTSAGHGERGWSNVDVSALQLAIDARARSEIEQRAGSLDASSLRDVIEVLRRAQLAWLYSAVSNHKPMSAASAEGIFRQLVVEARPESSPAEPADGEGVAVVTIVVAAHLEIPDLPSVATAPQIEALLASFETCARPELLVDAQVVWSPELGETELATKYPRLRKIDEASIGRVRCSQCRWPFAIGIDACPQCGAVVT